MEKLLSNKLGKIVVYVGVFLFISAFGLWSWNVLSELFGGPQAQYKHIVAVTSLILIVRILVFHKSNIFLHASPK